MFRFLKYRNLLNRPDRIFDSGNRVRCAGFGVFQEGSLSIKPACELILFEGRYEKDNPNVEVRVRRKELIKTAAA
jgi:hypothetical protein